MFVFLYKKNFYVDIERKVCYTDKGQSRKIMGF